MSIIIKLHECSSIEKANKLLENRKIEVYDRYLKNGSLHIVLAEWDEERFRPLHTIQEGCI